MAMMATTTSNSMRVKAIREERSNVESFMARIRLDGFIQRPENEAGNGKRTVLNWCRGIGVPTIAIADPAGVSKRTHAVQ
jgi:hypothetical protein